MIQQVVAGMALLMLGAEALVEHLVAAAALLIMLADPLGMTRRSKR